MARSYFNFIQTNTAQDAAVVWPLGLAPDDLDDMDQFNVELDLLSIQPEALVCTFLFDLNPGGSYGGYLTLWC